MAVPPSGKGNGNDPQQSPEFVVIYPDEGLETFQREPAPASDATEVTLFKRVEHDPASSTPMRIGSRSMSSNRWPVLTRSLIAVRAMVAVGAVKARHLATRSVGGLLVTGAALSVVLSLVVYVAFLRGGLGARGPLGTSLALSSLQPFQYPATSGQTPITAPAVLREDVAPSAPPSSSPRSTPSRTPAPSALRTNLPKPPPEEDPIGSKLVAAFRKIPEATPTPGEPPAGRIPATEDTLPPPTTSRPTTDRATSTAVPPAPAAPTPETASSAADTKALDTLVGRYRQAFNNLDASALESVWPSVNARSIGRAFDQLDSQQLAFDRCDTQVRVAWATVTCNGRATWIPRIGNKAPRVESRRWTFTFEKLTTGWVIRQVQTTRAS